MRYAKRDINISRPQMKIASLNVSAELEEFGNGKRKKIREKNHEIIGCTLVVALSRGEGIC